MIKGIIFDMDGVLTFTDKYHYICWKKIANQENIYFDEEINNRLRGVSRMDSLNIILEKANKELKGDTHAALFPDTDWACKELLEYCKEKKLNVVKEASMRRIEDIIENAKSFREAGYSIDIRLMAVPSIDSYVGTLQRFCEQLSEGENARWVTKKAHDETFEKIPETLKYLVDNKIYDKMTIYIRGNNETLQPKEIYPTEEREIVFKSPSEALEYGRTKCTGANKLDFWKNVGNIIRIIAKKSPNRIPELNYIVGEYNKRTDSEIQL